MSFSTLLLIFSLTEFLYTFFRIKDSLILRFSDKTFITFSLSLGYFTDRFADQRWLIYDRRRNYGYYYDGREAREVCIEDDRGMIADKLHDRFLAEEERRFQLLWKNYFRALAIPERLNEKQQRRMTVSYTHLDVYKRQRVNRGRSYRSNEIVPEEIHASFL